jgi:hypothetical protein
MILKNDFLEHIDTIIGCPYNKEASETHSIQTGFNCFTFAAYVYNLHDIKVVNVFDNRYQSLKQLRLQFFKVPGPAQFLDIVVFYVSDLDTRHIGVMLDENYMVHCSSVTNGIARNDVRRIPWSACFKGFYRHADYV